MHIRLVPASITSCGARSIDTRILGVVEDDVREVFGETADHFGHEILALEIADDHGHLFVQTDPKHSPADIARQFKSYSGKHLLERYSEIREAYFWGGGFWKEIKQNTIVLNDVYQLRVLDSTKVDIGENELGFS